MSDAKQQGPRFASVEAFEAWYGEQEGRWELHDGEAVAMSPERVVHARLKTWAWQALDRALREAGSRCEALLDGPMVPGPGLRRFQPDVVVSCETLSLDDVLVGAPVILVEVLSPSTAYVDVGLKLGSYFALPSVQHYLIVSARQRQVVHHRRWDGPGLLTSLHGAGAVELNPPGIAISVEEVYRDLDLED